MPDFPFYQKLLIWAVPVVFAITVHEVAHGWVAGKLGDPTARLLGRLTLNPIKHMDPVGTVFLPIVLLLASNFVFGWAKPVPVDWRNLRRPKLDMALVAVAGPGANLLMFAFWALFAKLILEMEAALGAGAVPLFYMGLAGVSINAVLMVLNLLPVPPLDGSRVVSALLPPSWAQRYNRLERIGLLIVIVLLVTGILSRIVAPPVQALQSLVQTLLSAG